MITISQIVVVRHDHHAVITDGQFSIFTRLERDATIERFPGLGRIGRETQIVTDWWGGHGIAVDDEQDVDAAQVGVLPSEDTRRLKGARAVTRFHVAPRLELFQMPLVGVAGGALLM